MPAPTITPLPPAPSRSDDPDNFADKADAFVAALPTFGAETQAAGEYAATKATESETSATNSASSASAASGSASAAAASATLASDWATKTDGAVSGGEYSAKKYATDAQTYANSVLNVANTVASSSTSESITEGAKTFTVETGKAFTAGQFVVIASAADVSNWMYAQITSYSGSTLVVNVEFVNGSGTGLTSWRIHGSAPIFRSPLLAYSEAEQWYLFGG